MVKMVIFLENVQKTGNLVQGKDLESVLIVANLDIWQENAHKVQEEILVEVVVIVEVIKIIL